MIRTAGWIMVLYGAAHTILGLTVEEAAWHADDWFSGELWGEDLAHMSEAKSALYLTLSSFGPPLVVIGLTVLWMDRQGITPPAFISVILGLMTVVDAVINLLSPWPVFLLANVLLLVAAWRAADGDDLTGPVQVLDQATPVRPGSGATP
jgi:hypothetical protein